uniref:Uncharacterized protein n=1 Tax=Arundo donax TaxID=35708 RepID=A0A0A8ZRP7_ARUDO
MQISLLKKASTILLHSYAPRNASGS